MRSFLIVAMGTLLALTMTSPKLAGAADGGDAAVEYGLAAYFVSDEGIEDDPAVIAATGFETADWAREAFGYTRTLPEGYEHTTDPSIVLAGQGCLQIQQRTGTHQPMEFSPSLPDTDTIYVRWYRRWEAGYDWTQHKMPGVYAKESSAQNGTAGIKPTGCDKYSCKLFVDWNARPAFYTYHPDQQGIYGDHIAQSIGTPVTLQTERWYCFEMMLKSNTPGQNDGELKMWIDGVLKGHAQGLRFRTCDTLKINEFDHSAYVGGTWVSERDQKLWDDNLVIATEYIGPMVHDQSAAEPSAEASAPSADSESGGGCFVALLFLGTSR